MDDGADISLRCLGIILGRFGVNGAMGRRRMLEISFWEREILIVMILVNLEWHSGEYSYAVLIPEGVGVRGTPTFVLLSFYLTDDADGVGLLKSRAFVQGWGLQKRGGHRGEPGLNVKIMKTNV